MNINDLPSCPVVDCEGHLEPKVGVVQISEKKLREEGYRSTQYWQCNICGKTFWRGERTGKFHPF